MKKFSELTMEQLTKIVNGSKELRDELDQYIQETEMEWLSEKLACVESSLSNWSIGFYNPNFMHVRDYEGFLYGVQKCTENFGCSDKLEKKIKQCEKLLRTNLFEHHAKILAEMWYKDEIQPIIDFVEDASYELYGGEVGKNCKDYLECFFDRYSDCLYDEETETFYEPHSLAIA